MLPLGGQQSLQKQLTKLLSSHYSSLSFCLCLYLLPLYVTLSYKNYLFINLCEPSYHTIRHIIVASNVTEDVDLTFIGQRRQQARRILFSLFIYFPIEWKYHSTQISSSGCLSTTDSYRLFIRVSQKSVAYFIFSHIPLSLSSSTPISSNYPGNEILLLLHHLTRYSFIQYPHSLIHSSSKHTLHQAKSNPPNHMKNVNFISFNHQHPSWHLHCQSSLAFLRFILHNWPNKSNYSKYWIRSKQYLYFLPYLRHAQNHLLPQKENPNNNSKIRNNLANKSKHNSRNPKITKIKGRDWWDLWPQRGVRM